MSRLRTLTAVISVVAAGACATDQPPAEPTPPPTASVLFSDSTASSGITFRHHNGRAGTHRYPEIMGGGVALFDYDGDGHLDIYFVNGNHLQSEPSPELINVLYRNRGDGTFEDRTLEAGVGDPGYGQGCCVADFDGDGDQDLYVTNFGPDRFYRNDGDGSFTDINQESGVGTVVDERLGGSAWGQACAFLDVDGDLDLDLYLQHYLSYDLDDPQEVYTTVRGRRQRDYLAPVLFPGAPDLLFANQGDGTFEDVTDASGLLRAGGRGMGFAGIDFDGDADLDLMIANDGMDNYYFENDGSGHFSELGHEKGVAFSGTGAVESSMGVDVGDVDGDGSLDVIIPVIRREVFTLYANQGRFFRDLSVQAGLAKTTNHATGFSPNLIDVDHDGDLDLFSTCGGVVGNENPPGDGYEDRYGMPDLLLLNDGRGRFSDPGEAAGEYFARSHIGRGSAAGDLDDDGDMDLVISNLDGPAVILTNHQNDGHGTDHWLSVRLRGLAPNTDAIGARVELRVADTTRSAVVRGGGSYLSVNDRRLHFGLGSQATIDRIVVHWPGGGTSVLDDVDVDRFLTIEQEAGP